MTVSFRLGKYEFKIRSFVAALIIVATSTFDARSSLSRARVCTSFSTLTNIRLRNLKVEKALAYRMVRNIARLDVRDFLDPQNIFRVFVLQAVVMKRNRLSLSIGFICGEEK